MGGPDRGRGAWAQRPDRLYVCVQLGMVMQVSGTDLLPRQTLTHSPYGPNSSALQKAEGLAPLLPQSAAANLPSDIHKHVWRGLS